MYNKLLHPLWVFAVFFSFKNIVFCAARRDRLLDAVHMADVEKVRELLAEKDSDILTSRLPVSLNAVDKDHGRTSLLSCGNDPQIEDLKKVDSQCTEIAQMLHKAGADLAHIDKHGWNAVSFAAVKGMVQFAKYLIMAGVPFDLRDEKGRTPLMVAATHGFTPVIKLLVENGANTSAADIHGWTVLHFIVRQASADNIFSPACSYVVNVLSNSDVINAKDELGRTALMHAAAGGNLEIVDMLLLRGADSRIAGDDGKTALDLTSDLDINRRITEWNVKLTLSDHERWLSESQLDFEGRESTLSFTSDEKDDMLGEF